MGYEGQFVDNQFGGLGVFLQKDGRKCEGTSRQSELRGKGLLQDPDGQIYEGEFGDEQLLRPTMQLSFWMLVMLIMITVLCTFGCIWCIWPRAFMWRRSLGRRGVLVLRLFGVPGLQWSFGAVAALGTQRAIPRFWQQVPDRPSTATQSK